MDNAIDIISSCIGFIWFYEDYLVRNIKDVKWNYNQVILFAIILIEGFELHKQ